MADAIITDAAEDGQSIPAALAATPGSKKSRSKATKPVSVEAPADHPLAALAEAEALIDAGVEAPIADIVTPPSTPTAAVPADLPKDSTMATTIENMTDQTTKAQAFFADANDRAKGAMAKSAKLFEDATAFSKGNVEAMVESSRIAAKGIETMGQDAAEFGRKQWEEATAAFKTLATVKSPTEFLKLQGDYVRQSFDSLVAETSRSTETALKLAGEVVQPLSNRFALAAEKMKTAA